MSSAGIHETVANYSKLAKQSHISDFSQFLTTRSIKLVAIYGKSVVISRITLTHVVEPIHSFYPGLPGYLVQDLFEQFFSIYIFTSL